MNRLVEWFRRSPALATFMVLSMCGQGLAFWSIQVNREATETAAKFAVAARDAATNARDAAEDAEQGLATINRVLEIVERRQVEEAEASKERGEQIERQKAAIASLLGFIANGNETSIGNRELLDYLVIRLDQAHEKLDRILRKMGEDPGGPQPSPPPRPVPPAGDVPAWQELINDLVDAFAVNGR